MANNHLTRVMVIQAEDTSKGDLDGDYILPFRAVGVDVVTDFDDVGTENEGKISFNAYSFNKAIQISIPEENLDAGYEVTSLGMLPTLLQFVEDTFGSAQRATIARNDEVVLDGASSEELTERKNTIDFIQKTIRLALESDNAEGFMNSDPTGWLRNVLHSDIEELHSTLLVHQAPTPVDDDFDAAANIEKVLQENIDTTGDDAEGDAEELTSEGGK